MSHRERSIDVERTRRKRRTRARAELGVMALEGRVLLTVTDVTTGMTFATIQAAVDAAAAGDTLKATAGTYNETVNVTKTLTIQGARSGVDARNRPGGISTESVVTGTTGGFTIDAKDVVIDGFTIDGATGGPGISTTPTTAGDQILNNIINNNVQGILLASNGTSPTLVKQNEISNNNQAGTHSGFGIFSDQNVQDATIDSNAFLNNSSGDIRFVGATVSQVGIDITNNGFSGGSIGLSDVSGSIITGNTMTGTAGPAIELGGGDAGISIESNTIVNNATIGVDVSTTLQTTASANSNVTIRANRFFGNSKAGVSIAAPAAYTGGALDAVDNWWGSNAGPNQTGNDSTSGDVNATPWIVMTIAATRPTVGPGGSSEVTAGFTTDSNGGALPAGATFPDGTAVAFSATGGTMAPTSALTATGSAMSTFTAGSAGDASSKATLDDQSLTVPITVQAITITPATLSPTTIGQSVNQTITATGGAGTFTYTVTAGALPDGLALASGSGALTGTPTSAGTTTFTVTATDISGGTGTQGYSFVVNPAVTFTTTTLPATTAGIAYSQQLATTGGTSPTTFAVTTGTLPAGVTLSMAGLLSGTPTTAGSSAVTVTATDAAGAKATQDLTLLINPAVTFTTTTLPATTLGASYNHQVSATGGTGSLTFAVTTGTLPAGVTLSMAGLLSGTPTAAGSSTFTVTATDSLGAKATQGLTLLVNPAVTFTTTTLPATTAGIAYSQQLATTGGTSPTTFAVTTGTLPAGVTLSMAGLLSGTPTTAGSSAVTVTATDAAGAKATQNLTLLVNPPVAITTTTLPATTAGISYIQTLAATGGTGSLTYSVTTGTLPAGLSLSPSGAISGTPTAAGSSPFTVTATDSLGATATKNLTILVNPAVTLNATAPPAGSVGSAYSSQISATGGTGALTYAVTTGTLPAGLTLSSSGLISGTPTTAGSSTFFITATDSLGASGSAVYSIPIRAALAVSPSALPAGVLNTSYIQTISATGGTGPYTFAVTSGTLPTGLTLSSAGLLNGTPTAAGSSTFTVTATDANSATATQAFTLAVNPVLAINQATLPATTVGSTYSQQFSTTGGATPITYAVTTGTLPTGLTLSPVGLLSGTPTAAGSSTFTVTATDANSATATQAITLVVNPAVAITTTTLPATTLGQPYIQTLAATGGTGTLTFAVTTGTLPAGLSLSSDGVISGTTTTAQTSAFTVTVTDATGSKATQNYSLVVNPALAIGTTSLTGVTVGSATSEQIATTGGTSPVAYAVTAGTLPAGLTLSTSGLISGTATTAGSSTFTVKATDASGASATKDLTLVVSPAITFGTTTLPATTINRPYSQQIAATGGSGTLTFAVTTGTLPTGLTLTPAGLLSGTPTAAGSSTFTVTATDGNGAKQAQALTLVVNPALAIGTTSLSPITVGTATSQQLHSTGGTSPVTYAVTTGTLPAGLTLSTSGLLSGTATTAGSSTFTVTATDASGGTATQVLSVVANPAIAITTASLPTATVGTAYSQALAATGGSGTLTYSLGSGTLPAGLTLSSAGLISGTPTTAGSSTFTVVVTDQAGATASHQYSLTTNATYTLNPTAIPAGVINTAYSQQLNATGGSGTSTFAVTTGALPAGLTLSTSGLISGTPTTAGSSTFTVQATDAASDKASRVYTLAINSTLAINQATLPSPVVGSAYSQQLSVTGGTTPFTYTLASGALPAGLTLSSTGLISGTPTTAGNSSFTVRATDANGATATQDFMVMTNPALAITQTTLPAAVLGTAYNQQITATGGVSPYTFAVTNGSLPAGLTLGTTGAITGTPTAAGTSTFTVTTMDQSGATATQTFTLAVNSTLAINQTTLPAATTGTAYSQQLSVTGGATPVTYSLLSGTLPAGLTLSTSGLISGTPTTAGSSTFTVQATDANGATATQALTLAVNAPAVVAPPTVTNLQRFGFHLQPTEYVITFSSAMDPTRAQNVSNYVLKLARGGPAIRITSAVYDAVAHTVTLRTAKLLNVHRQYSLTINGMAPSGLTGQSTQSGQTGPLLDGQGNGSAGSNYTRTFGMEILAGPSTVQSSKVRAKIHATPAVASGHKVGALGHLSGKAVDAVLHLMKVRRHR